MAILIKNGSIFDGSGQKGERTDVLIEGDKISAIGALAKKKVETIIDASGLYLTPGFIDINSDSDHYLTIFTQPNQSSLLEQGITTILTGNCGSSLAPLVKGNLISIRKWSDSDQINIDWQSFGDFLEKLSRFKIGVNFGTLIGHSTIRRGIVGEEFRDLTDSELRKMKYLVEKSLAEGAFGVSTGLGYSHSRITPQYEILEIAKIIEKYNGLYATHLRSEKEGLLAAIAELEDLVSEFKNFPKIEISHLKAYAGSEDDLNQSLKLINDLKNHGVDINFDVYPYQTTANPLYTYLPTWAVYGGMELMIKNISNRTVRQRVIKELKERPYNFSKIIVAEASKFPSFVGKSIAELATKRNIDFEEMLLDILVFSGGRATVFEDNLSENGVEALLKNPLSLIATNGPGFNNAQNDSFLAHQRSFGAFPKFLGLVRDKKLMSWPEAIRKITSEPAKKIGLRKRGLIKKGYFADLVVLNPDTINSGATLRNPYLRPEGIKFVILNGQLVVKESLTTGVLAGQIFKR